MKKFIDILEADVIWGKCYEIQVSNITNTVLCVKENRDELMFLMSGACAEGDFCPIHTVSTVENIDGRLSIIHSYEPHTSLVFNGRLFQIYKDLTPKGHIFIRELS